MIMKMFTVYDMKAEFFGQPFFEQEEASAIRSFGDAVNDSSNPANQWNKHPEDFQLYLIGAFDNETGNVESYLPKAIVMANSLHKKNNPELPGLEVIKNNDSKNPSVH